MRLLSRTALFVPIAGVALIAAPPALARDDASSAEMLEQLNDPLFQDSMAAMIGGLMGAMMDLPIGQFANAMEKAIPQDMRGDNDFSDIDPDATLGELAGADDPDFERNMQDKVRKGTAMAGIMASEFGALLPQLEAMAENMKRRMGDLD